MLLNENEIENILETYLINHNYKIISKSTTSQKGVDINATNLLSGRSLWVEAKGGTTSKNTVNIGNPFDKNQIRNHIGIAFFQVAQLRSKYLYDEIAIALPDEDEHIRLINYISEALKILRIGVYFIRDENSIRLIDFN